MKKFRPYNAGYIVIYLLVLACAVDAVWSIVRTVNAGAESNSDMFLLWTLILLPLALVYANRYRQTVVEISSTRMRIVRPALVDPKPGAKRASFIFRQGDKDNALIERSFELSQLAKYGYIETFGLKAEDKGGGKPNGKLFPLHEIAFVMQDGRNCRMNAPIYSKKQLREIVQAIRDNTGIEPTGALAEELKAE